MPSQLTAKELLEKDPDEKLIFTMDFSDRIDEDVTISSITSVTSELVGGGTSDLTISGSGISEDSITFFVEAGTHGRKYRVESKIVLSNGEILVGAGMLHVYTR